MRKKIKQLEITVLTFSLFVGVSSLALAGEKGKENMVKYHSGRGDGGVQLRGGELLAKPSAPSGVSLTVIANENQTDKCPCVVELPDGNMLCVYDSFRGSLSTSANSMAYKISTDKGKSWGPRRFFGSEIPNTCDNRSSICMTSWGTIFLTWQNFPTGGRLTSLSLYYSTSTDGYNWSPAREIPTGGISDRTHGLIELSNGNLIIPFSWWKGKPGQRYHVASVVISTDRGKTWHRGRDLDAGDFGYEEEWHRGLLEPTIAELSDGRLLMIMRAQTNTGTFYKSYSYDGGETWTPAVPEPKLKGARQGNHLYRLKSGNLVYVWNNNISGVEFRDRTPLSIAISTNDGKTWKAYREVANYPNILYDNTHPGLACTLGHVTQLRDGSIGVAFHTGVCWDRAEISFARFTEEWLLEEEKGFFDGFEHGLREWTIGKGDISIASETKKSGKFALEINDISTDRPTELLRNIPIAIEGKMNFWVYLDKLNSGFVFSLGDGYAEVNSGYWSKARFVFHVDADGSLMWRDGSDGDLKELPVVTDLPLKVWTKMELNWNSDSEEVDIFVDGKNKGTVSAYKEGIGICYIHFGSGSVSGTGDNIYIDDVYVCEGSQKK